MKTTCKMLLLLFDNPQESQDSFLEGPKGPFMTALRCARIFCCPRRWEAPAWLSAEAGGGAIRLGSCRQGQVVCKSQQTWLPSPTSCEPLRATGCSPLQGMSPATVPRCSQPGPRGSGRITVSVNDGGPSFCGHRCDSGLCSSQAERHPQPHRGNYLPLQWPLLPHSGIHLLLLSAKVRSTSSHLLLHCCSYFCALNTLCFVLPQGLCTCFSLFSRPFS